MTETNNPEIDIAVPEQRWESALPGLRALTDKAIRRTLKQLGKTPGEISIVFANDSFVQDLNRRYRGKDKPTNVLSFGQDEDETLGDVVLAFETVERESGEQNKKLEDHVTHLIVHGTLHLLGLNHENDAEAEEMENLEIAVLKDLDIKNPYETPGSVS